MHYKPENMAEHINKNRKTTTHMNPGLDLNAKGQIVQQVHPNSTCYLIPPPYVEASEVLIVVVV